MLALLPGGQEISDFAVVGVIFDADIAIFAEIAGEPYRRSKIRFAASAKAQIYDRIDDEFPVRVSTPMMGRISSPHGFGEKRGIS